MYYSDLKKLEGAILILLPLIVHWQKFVVVEVPSKPLVKGQDVDRTGCLGTIFVGNYQQLCPKKSKSRTRTIRSRVMPV
jgi:hypothetical protein